MLLPRRAPFSFLFVLGCGALLISCARDPNVRKQRRFAKGLEELQKGDVKRATLELRAALQIDPNFAEAANVLAEIDFKQGNYEEAYRLLQRAVAVRPDYLPAHKGLAQLYRLGGKLSEAESEAEFVLKKDSRDVDARLNLATVQQAQNKLSEAEANFDQVLEIKPGQADALFAMAVLRQRAGRLPAAEGYLRKAVESNPASLAAHLSLIRFYIATNRAREAEPLFADALRATNNPAVLEAQANYYIGLRELGKAEEVLRRMQTTPNQDPLYWGALGDFYVRTNAWDKAKAEYERILQQHPGELGTGQKLIEVHLMLNDRNAAEALNEAVLKKSPKDAHAHLVKGRVYLADGDIDNALLEFNKAREYQADMPALHYWYAQAYQQKGRLGEAKQELETALKYDPAYLTARLNLAALQNRTGAFDGTLADIRKVLSKDSGNVPALLVYGRALLAKGDYGQAGKVLKVAAQLAPGSGEVHRQLSSLRLATKNLQGARQEFEEAWKLQPGASSLQPVLEGILKAYVTNGQLDGALEYLRRQLQGRPQDAMLHHEMAQLYLLQNKRGESIAALNKSLALEPENITSTLLLADLYAADKRPDLVSQLIAGIMRKHSQNADVLVRSGVLFEKIKRWDDARSAYEQALQLNGNNPIVKNNLAWIVAEHGGNMDVALDLAQQAKNQLGNDLQITNTLGWIYYKKGVYRTALTYLKECADRDRKNPTFQYQLGLAYLQVGDRQEARRALLNALTLDPKLTEAGLARAALAQMSAGRVVESED